MLSTTLFHAVFPIPLLLASNLIPLPLNLSSFLICLDGLKLYIVLLTNKTSVSGDAATVNVISVTRLLINYDLKHSFLSLFKTKNYISFSAKWTDKQYPLLFSSYEHSKYESCLVDTNKILSIYSYVSDVFYFSQKYNPQYVCQFIVIYFFHYFS